MYSAIVPLMDTKSAMLNALNIGADDGRKTANGTEKGNKMANEKRLIDANALAEEVWNIAMYIFGVRNGKTLIKEYLEKYRDSVMKKIANAPIVDAVEVVRCKDCMHYIKLLENGNDYRCSIFCGCYDRPYPTEADDFCSYGVKKDNSNISRKCDGVKVFCDGNCNNCPSKETWDRLKEVFDEIYDDEDGERKDNEA